MSKPTLDSIASAKAKLEQELRQLDEQESQLRQQQSAEAVAQIMDLLTQYQEHFTDGQKAQIAGSLGAARPGRAKKTTTGKEVAPKYWLPHSGETWSGRGRAPRAFVA